MGVIHDRGHDGGNTYRWQTIERWVNLNQWKTGAELGVWYGETFKHLITHCPNLSLIGVDLYEQQPDNPGPQKYIPGEDGHVWTHEAYYQEMIEFCSQYPDRTTLIKSSTIDASRQVEDDSLDFVFIDADHSTEGVDQDIIHWSPKVKKGGYIIGHDIHWPTVRTAVERHFIGNYKTEEDFIWYVVKD